MQTLPSVVGIPSLHLFFPLPPLEQVPLEPAVEVFPAFWAILEVVAIVLLYYFALELVASILITPSSFIFPSCSPFNVYLD